MNLDQYIETYNHFVIFFYNIKKEFEDKEDEIKTIFPEFRSQDFNYKIQEREEHEEKQNSEEDIQSIQRKNCKSYILAKPVSQLEFLNTIFCEQYSMINEMNENLLEISIIAGMIWWNKLELDEEKKKVHDIEKITKMIKTMKKKMKKKENKIQTIINAIKEKKEMCVKM